MPVDTPAERARCAAGEPTRLTAAERVRFCCRVAVLVLAMVVCVPLHYLWRVLAYGSPIPMLFLRLVAWVLGARVVRHGTPLRRNVLFLANHVSWLDIPALAGATGCAFVAKAELEAVPLVGWLASLNRTIYVSREDRMAVADQINALREALADAWSITIFPEGTTTDGHSLLPFKSSMLRVLEPPPGSLLVQPVLLDYGVIAEWIGWVGEENGANNAKRIFARKGSFPLHIHFLDPFDPREFAGRKAISAEAQRRIEAALVETLGKPVRAFAHDVGSVRYTAPPKNP